MAQETQTGTLYQPRGVGWGGRWEGGSKGRAYMYTYGWLLLMFDRKQQNSVKQLSFNKKINWIKKKQQPSASNRINSEGTWQNHGKDAHCLGQILLQFCCITNPVDLNSHLLLWWPSRSWSSCVSTGELCADLFCVFPSLLGSAGWPELALLRLKSLSRNMKDFLMPDLELAHNCFYPLPLAEAGPTSQAKVKTLWPEVLAQRNGLLGRVNQSTMKTKLLTRVISQEKILHDYFMHLFIKYWLVVVLVSNSCPSLANPWTVACRTPLSMGFLRQEYWSLLSFPAPGDLPDPRIEPMSPALHADSLLLSHQWSPNID